MPAIRFVGIDPGKSGCIAWIELTTPNGEVHFTSKFDKLTELDIVNELRSLASDHCYAVIERVRSSPQMGVTSAFTFGRGYGLLLGALAASGIPYTEALPSKWQGALGCRTKGDKNVSKRKAQQLYPKLEITHTNADAILIATYCKQNHKDLF